MIPNINVFVVSFLGEQYRKELIQNITLFL